MVMSAILLLAMVAIAIVVRLLHNCSRLKSIPGPFFAAFSDLWRLHAQRSPGYGRRLAELHREYGRVVRLGPDFVSLCDSATIAQVYRERLHSELGPSDRSWGFVEASLSHGSQDLTRDFNPMPRRSDETAQYEGSIDTLARKMLRTIRQHRVLDVTASLRFFAEEFIDQLVLQVSAVQPGTASSTSTNDPSEGSNRSGSGTSIPTIEEFLLRGPVALLKRNRIFCSAGQAAAGFGSAFMKPAYERALLANQDQGQGQDQNPGPDRWGDNPTTAAGVQSMTAAFAGVFWFLLRHRGVMARLRDEIDVAFRTRITQRVPLWSEIKRLSYLDAVMKESLRLSDHQEPMQTAQGGSAAISKIGLPEGTVAGWHLDTLRFSAEVYGGDAYFFRPERWLVVDRERREVMEQSLLPFSVCVESSPMLGGAWLELKKTIVVLLREFDIELLDCEQGLELDECPPSMMARFSLRMIP